ncbi:hypothetical protein GC207_03285 [bacterium]|nr:hypothetical protein [bacterium]
MNEITNTFSRSRKWSIGFQVAVSVLAFAAIVVMVNYLSARHFQRFHWSTRSSTALTPKTLALLKNMTNQVDITVFFASGNELVAPIDQLLAEYEAANPNIKVTKVDPILNPAGAQKVRTRYALPQGLEDNLVIVSHGKRVRVLSERMLTDSEYVKVPNAEKYEVRPRYLAFKGELMFSSAIADVISTRQQKAYFLTNHDEHNPSSTEAQQGYASFADLLRENNVRFDVLNLGVAGEIPRDCDLLIIPGPQKKFLPTELDRIEQYLNQGGRMLVMFNIRPVVTLTDLEVFLRQWGVDVGRNLVEDKENGLQGEAAYFETSRFGNHPIVGPLGDVKLVVSYPRTIAKLNGDQKANAGLTVSELVYSGTNSVVISQFPDGQPARSGRDPHGSFPLAVAVEKGGLPGITTLRGGVTRMVVIGDSYLFDNQMINLLGNRDFANQIINWLLDRSELMVGINPRPMQEYQLALTPGQMRNVRLVLIGGLPAIALVVGLLVWLRRRN